MPWSRRLARAFRWRKMPRLGFRGVNVTIPHKEAALDDGAHATLEHLARAKGVAPSYVSRVLRLTLLAPDIVEAGP